MNTIVFVEDDAEVGALIAAYLAKHDMQVTVEPRGDRAEETILRENPDLVLLDIMLPGKDGMTICRDLRAKWSGPIVLLTSLDSDMNHILALEMGACDYILKTTPPAVLLARLRLHLRQNEQATVTKGIQETSLTPYKALHFGTLTIDPINRVVTLANTEISLSTADFELLWELATHAGQIMDRDALPTEEEQFRAYKTVVETMAGKKVIVRTLDIGADKQVDYFGLDKEDNPALGYRAIRICLKQPDIFRTQLRAIYRASHYGTLSIMFPMIISVDEVRVIKRIVNEVKSELDEQEIPYGTVELGIMIETPAAVMISDLLAKEVDFFSIGTNDLTQYTLAIDRQNPKLDDFYNSHHEAVLRMIRMVVENGHKEGCWVGICGELGADTSLTETFVSMGIDELSVSPSMVLKVREAVRNIED